MTLEPISNNDAMEWVRNYLGDSFVKGLALSTKLGYARVIAKTEDGEKEVKISIPRKVVSQ